MCVSVHAFRTHCTAAHNHTVVVSFVVAYPVARSQGLSSQTGKTVPRTHTHTAKYTRGTVHAKKSISDFVVSFRYPSFSFLILLYNVNNTYTHTQAHTYTHRYSDEEAKPPTFFANHLHSSNGAPPCSVHSPPLFFHNPILSLSMLYRVRCGAPGAFAYYAKLHHSARCHQAIHFRFQRVVSRASCVV